MNARTFILAIASLTCIAASAVGQTRPVTLEWDESPDSSVAGYIVFVGSASGMYEERHDVGLQTSFVYAGVVPGRPYYFAVAAYSPGPIVGPRSEEVFFLAGAATASNELLTGKIISLLSEGFQNDVDATNAATSTVAGRSTAPRVVCVRTSECYEVDTLAQVAGSVSGLTLPSDGRVLFIEDGQHVRVVDDDVLVPEPALTAGASSALAGLVLDAEFVDTRLVYIGLVETTADGRRELNIVRYREVANVLGEGAVIVAGLPLPTVGDAALAIDSSRRLYVAMPAAPASDPRAARYAGMVLRFESDGTAVRDDGADAPVLSRGYMQPTSLAWSGLDNHLWLAGTGADWEGTLARLALGGASGGRTVPESVAFAAGSTAMSLSVPESTAGAMPSAANRTAVFVVDEAGGVFRVMASPDGMTTAALIAADELEGRVVAVVGGSPDGDLLLAVTTGAAPASVSSRIMRLQHQ